ncbi:MAG: hypothetical protein AB1650_02655 [Candidatus Omnitrophota bacterium]
MIARYSKWHFWLSAGIIAAAVWIRLSVFVQSPALWSDEALTANKLIWVPLNRLIQPKGSNYGIMHAYPLGFMALTKALIKILGASEFSLRLIPFLSGLLSLFLFGRVTRYLFRPEWGLLALAMFAFSYPLIYHSVELKPYSSDVLIAVILLFVTILTLKRSRQITPVQFCAIGMYGLLFSFPAVFIIFPFLGLWILESVLKKEGKEIFFRLKIFIFLFAFELMYFLFSLRFYLKDPQLGHFWRSGFLSISKLPEIWANGIQTFPLLFWTILSIAGAAWLIKNRRRMALVCLTPLIAVLVASSLHLYPIASRTVLFLIPFFIILATFGIKTFFMRKFPQASSIVVAFLIAALLWPSLNKLPVFLTDFSFGEDIRPLVYFLHNNRKEGEGLYMNELGEQNYRFYGHVFGFGIKNYSGIFGSMIEKINDKTGILFGFEPLDNAHLSFLTETGEFYIDPETPGNLIRPGRNWFLIAHSKTAASQILFNYLDRIGQKLLVMKTDRDAALYLYDIGQHVPQFRDIFQSSP